MEITRKEIGYTIYARLEGSMRLWIRDKLWNLFGSEWISHIPTGVWDKTKEKLALTSIDEVTDPTTLLEETDMPDLMEIVCYKKGQYFYDFVPRKVITQEEFRNRIIRLYPIRVKIAHVKESFSFLDLDLLVEIAESLLPILSNFADELKNVLECIKTNPEKVIIRIPNDFFIFDEPPSFAYINNLPTADYASDGGFVGRKEDLKKIEELVFNDLYRVVTIAGAGGVGKTALTQKFCADILSTKTMPFDAVVWVSAKEERLSLTGIEPIEPTFRTYEEFLDSILETFGWHDELNADIGKKEESVEIILRAGDKGILVVVDNLETIRDERVIEFIKAFPPPSKILITSRSGLGEVERRYHLNELDTKDAIILLRTIAREKGVYDLAKLPDDVLSNYVDKMFRYPLAIKWVVGQVALGKDPNIAICDLTSSEGDVAKFCFEHIFNTLLNDNARTILYALAAYDKPLVRGVLSHLTDLQTDDLEKTLRELTIASLIIPKQIQSSDSTIETRYELLPLTKNYMQSKLMAHPDIHKQIESRTEAVRNLIEEADRAGRQYRYSLSNLGAKTEEEKIAATWAFTAHQKYQAGDYDGALQCFNRATEIAPNFPAVYRNWATMESEAGFFERANELMEKATKLDDSDPRLWFVWGNIEKRRDRHDRAYTYLKKALDLSPDDPHVMGALAEVEKRRNNFESADSLLRKALSSESVEILQTKRHEIICLTSLADNSRRWAEVMKKNRFSDEEVLSKLEDSFKFASEAVNLSKADVKSQDTLREVVLELAFQIKRVKGFVVARPYFEQAIVQSPRRAKEKRINEPACYTMAISLMDQGKAEEAKKYYNLGRKSLLEGSRRYDDYRELYAEIHSRTLRGKLYNIVKDKGYGFLEVDGQPGQSAFLHMSNITPNVQMDEFEEMQGYKFSFILEPNTGKSPNAKRARLIKE